MRRLSSVLAIACALTTPRAFGSAPPTVRARPAVVRVMSPTQAKRFMSRQARRENAFYKPGIAYDDATGLTHDGHGVDWETGALRGGPRPFSAASKESLHLILLTKALAGDATARTLLSPDPRHPAAARATALQVLERKITSYERFDRAHPGYGGFLPWYQLADGQVTPDHGWEDRVPGLDNGQLAWSLYHTANLLKELGEPKLAARYEQHLAKMRANVVRIFYDPAEHKLSAEAKLVGGNRVAPEQNQYANNVKNYHLDDSYEGELLGHFADLMGDWSAHPEGKDAIWKAPRQLPVTAKIGRHAITNAIGHWSSSHEVWGDLVLPYRDVDLAARLFMNKERARTAQSAKHGWPGFLASTHQPVPRGEIDGGYVSNLGVAKFAKMKTVKKPIFAPYATFPLALVDKPMFATWLSSTLKLPGMQTPYGMGESVAKNGDHAPVLTWDGKALPLVAWMGGIGPDIRRLLKRDGLYDAFLARVEHDFQKFEGIKLEGEHLPLRPPPPRRAPN